MVRLRKIITDYGLTQERAAEMAGVHASRLSLILNGKATPNDKEAAALARAFESPIPELLEVVNEQTL